MKMVYNYLYLFILFIIILLQRINGKEIILNSFTGYSLHRTDNRYYKIKCTDTSDCGYKTHMTCKDGLCVCDINYVWDSSVLKCLKYCVYYPECNNVLYNRYCNQYENKCVCGLKYEEVYGSDICAKKHECYSSLDCLKTRPNCNTTTNKCECYIDQIYNYETNSCETNKLDNTYAWAYYLWTLLLIPLALTIGVLYYIYREKKLLSGSVMVNNNRVKRRTIPHSPHADSAAPSYTIRY